MSDMKTLKDIIVEQSGGTRVHPIIKEGKIPNTSDKIYLDAIGVIDRKIREEAKKWRSVLSDKIEDSIKYVGKRKMNLIPVTDILYYSAQIRWITHFFNLEEDD